METNSSKSKRIAKNTIYLYLRMILMMVVNLYTSRIILNVLGVEDYGIYNVVGGVVTMFAFLSSSLSSAISRFVTFELGKGNTERLTTLFSTSVNILMFLGVVILVLAEIVGVWFINTHLNIPIDRLDAANWVFQSALLVFLLGMICVPYNAVLIAHEHMSVYAYISLVEVFLKLIVTASLYFSTFDKLKSYSVLLVFVAIIMRLIYSLYCSRKFKECKYRFEINKECIKSMGGFAGWNLLGNGAYLLNTQGVNIITNMFFNVTLNAARGVATQVEGVIRLFVTNFTTALNPQITKSYAAGDLHYMFNLICKGAKYSYILMLFFVVPFLYEADYVLALWLGNIPPYASLFLKLTMIGSLLDILGNSTANAAWATGDVKRYYIYVGFVGLMVFPLSLIFFELGFPAYTSYLAFILIYSILIFVKLYIIKGLLQFPMQKFIKDTLLRIVPTTVIALIIPYPLYLHMEDSFLRLLSICIVSTFAISIIFFFTGLEANEKSIPVKFIDKYIHKKYKK